MRWKLPALALLSLLAAGPVFFPALFAWSASIPSTVTATPAAPVVVQQSYRWYQNIDALDPTTPAAAENVSLQTQPAGTQARLRTNIANAGGAALAAGAIFTLQYANATSGPWTDVATSTAWSFFNNPSVADGQIIVNTLLGSSTVGESYGESNPSAAMPTQLLSGDVGEWDWALVNVSADISKNWIFRMVNASGTPFDAYAQYPTFTAVPSSNNGGGGGSSGGSGPVQGGGGGTGYYQTPLIPSATLPGGEPLLPPQFQIADFNGDNRIDISDLSIMLYYYERSDHFALRYDLNKDSVVDFPDVSILMYYWTGP